jgi:MscS family membrane protein
MRRSVLAFFLTAICLGFVLSIGAGMSHAQTDQPVQIPTSTVGPAPIAGGQAATGEPAPSATAAPEGEEAQPTATRAMEGVVSTRTPAPTATPGWIAEEVTEFTSSVGLAGRSYLGLSADDWINLWISILSFILAYLAGTWVIRRVLPRAVRRTPSEFDDRLLKAVGPQLRWLVVLAILFFATQRLSFVSAELKAILNDVYFVLAVILGLHVVWKLIDLGGQWYGERATGTEREDELAPLTTLLGRLAHIVAVLACLGILLEHFGVNLVAFTAALGIGGLALSLAARDTIADMIAGFVILLDRPFRIGDRIEIQGIGTWGDVVDIGLRTTRIRTRDNRMVIVPNATIGTNEIVNYTYPDPKYRIETQVEISYDTDIEAAEQVIVEAVRRVEGVLPDQLVEALYIEMGDAGMIFLVRWWIESYEDTRSMFDRVHRSLQKALDEAGIVLPNLEQDINLRLGPETAIQLADALGSDAHSGPVSAGQEP